MPDFKNLISIQGGLTADPEKVADGKILKLRLASDYSGREGNETTSGYFDVVYFLNNEDRNAKFVRSQVDNFKKGTQLGIVGRLIQERWEKDGVKGSAVRIYADTISYAGSRPKDEGEEAEGLPLSF